MSNAIDNYLTGSQNSTSIFIKTLQSLNILSTPGAIYTAGTSSFSSSGQVLDTLHAQNPSLDINYKIQTNSGVIGGVMNVVSATQNGDGSTAYVVEFANGAAGIFVGDSVAAAVARGLASIAGIGTTSVSIVAAEVVIAVAAGALVTTAIAEGYHYITQDLEVRYDEALGYTYKTDGWSVQDMLQESLYESIFRWGEEDLKSIYEVGKSFKLETNKGEAFFTYIAENSKAYYKGSLAQAEHVSANGKSALEAMVEFFDKKAFQLIVTDSIEPYTIYSLIDRDRNEIISLTKSNGYAFDAILNLTPKPYIIDNNPSVITASNPSIHIFSDIFLEKRAEFLKRVVEDNSDYVNSYSAYSYYDTNLGMNSIGGGFVYVNFGSTPYRISGKVATYLFGSVVGNKNNIIKGSYDTDDYVEGLDGSDTIYTYGGNDTIYTNANISSRYDRETSSTTNTVYAGDGDDKIYESQLEDIKMKLPNLRGYGFVTATNNIFYKNHKEIAQGLSNE